MSQQHNSVIGSSFFADDPILGRGLNKKKNQDKSDEVILTKGEDTPSNNSNDIIIIKGPDGKQFQVHRNVLIETMEQLRPNILLSISKLEPTQLTAFKSVVESLNLIKSSPEVHNLILNDIKEVLKEVKDYKPGSLAAYFIGCLTDRKFPGPIGCDPKCTASLMSDDPKFTTCDGIVLIYDEGKFSSLNDKTSTLAYIYIEGKNFKGFTNDNITQLMNAGITEAIIIYGGDPEYQEVTQKTPLVKLPQINTTLNNTLGQNEPAVSNTASDSGAGWVILIIVIIIAILLGVLLWRMYAPASI